MNGKSIAGDQTSSVFTEVGIPPVNGNGGVNGIEVILYVVVSPVSKKVAVKSTQFSPGHKFNTPGVDVCKSISTPAQPGKAARIKKFCGPAHALVSVEEQIALT